MSDGEPSPPGKPWFLYFLECRDGSVYTGITTDVARRFEKHRAGKGARYTRMNPPVRIVGSVPFENKSAALSAEMRFKRLSASAKREWIAQACNSITTELNPANAKN